MPGLVPADEVLSLTPEKVPKERVQGADPLDTPLVSRGASLSFRRPYPDTAPAPQAGSALAASNLSLEWCPRRGAWPGKGLNKLVFYRLSR